MPNCRLGFDDEIFAALMCLLPVGWSAASLLRILDNGDDWGAFGVVPPHASFSDLEAGSSKPPRRNIDNPPFLVDLFLLSELGLTTWEVLKPTCLIGVFSVCERDGGGTGATGPECTGLDSAGF